MRTLEKGWRFLVSVLASFGLILVCARHSTRRIFASPRLFHALGALVATGVAALYMLLPAELTIHTSAAVGRCLFGALLGQALFLAAVYVPATAATALAADAQSDVFEELLMTTLRPWHLVAANFLAVLGFFFLSLTILAPFGGVLMMLVGVDGWQLLHGCVLCLGTGVASAALGLLSGLLLRGLTTAIVLSLVFSAGVQLLPALFMLLLFPLYLANPEAWALGLCASPAFAILRTMREASDAAFYLALGYLGIATLAALAALAWRASRLAHTSDAAPPTEHTDTAHVVIFERLFGLGAFRWIANPVARRILCGTPANRGGFLAGYAALLACAYLGSLIEVAQSGAGNAGSYRSLQATTLALCLAIPAVAAAQWIHERTSASFDLLRMSILRTRTLVLGHFTATLIAFSPALILVACQLLLCALDTHMPGYWALALFPTLGLLGLGAAAGLFAAQTTPRPAQALAMAYAVAGTAIFAAVFALEWTGYGSGPGPRGSPLGLIVPPLFGDGRHLSFSRESTLLWLVHTAGTGVGFMLLTAGLLGLTVLLAKRAKA